jgi:riboflavin synthase
MFTGLIEGKGIIKKVSRVRGDVVLTVSPLFDLVDGRLGDSISVNGVCLTVTSLEGGFLQMDVSEETVSRSTMGLLKPGDHVNMERALRLSDRLGGHLVSGHVDGVGKVLKKEQKQKSWLFRIGIDKSLGKYIIEKGSVAVDGISLTINDCQDTFFEVNIIPQTAQETTLLEKKIGDSVNIETDLIGKYVEKFLLRDKLSDQQKESSAINEDMLRKFGFGE